MLKRQKVDPLFSGLFTPLWSVLLAQWMKTKSIFSMYTSVVLLQIQPLTVDHKLPHTLCYPTSPVTSHNQVLPTTSYRTSSATAHHQLLYILWLPYTTSYCRYTHCGRRTLVNTHHQLPYISNDYAGLLGHKIINRCTVSYCTQLQER